MKLFLLAAATALIFSGSAPQRQELHSAEPAQAAAPPSEFPPVVRGGALDTDCSHVGDEGYGYQFIGTCSGKVPSPDGRFAVVQERGETGEIFVADREGRKLETLYALMDGMPFVVMWSPGGDWFAVNHYVGSGNDRIRLFQVVNSMAVERSAAFAEAAREIAARYPCLARGASIYASARKWSRDGQRLAMAVYARPDACLVETRSGSWEPDGKWEALWMIGDVGSGTIDPASVRVRPGGVGPMPDTGPYAGF